MPASETISHLVHQNSSFAIFFLIRKSRCGYIKYLLVPIFVSRTLLFNKDKVMKHLIYYLYAHDFMSGKAL